MYFNISIWPYNGSGHSPLAASQRHTGTGSLGLGLGLGLGTRALCMALAYGLRLTHGILEYTWTPTGHVNSTTEQLNFNVPLSTLCTGIMTIPVYLDRYTCTQYPAPSERKRDANPNSRRHKRENTQHTDKTTKENFNNTIRQQRPFRWSVWRCNSFEEQRTNQHSYNGRKCPSCPAAGKQWQRWFSRRSTAERVPTHQSHHACACAFFRTQFGAVFLHWWGAHGACP